MLFLTPDEYSNAMIVWNILSISATLFAWYWLGKTLPNRFHAQGRRWIREEYQRRLAQHAATDPDVVLHALVESVNKVGDTKHRLSPFVEGCKAGLVELLLERRAVLERELKGVEDRHRVLTFRLKNKNARDQQQGK